MNTEVVKENEVRVFLKTNEEECFECFTDGTKQRVGEAWLMEKMKNNRKYGFRGILFAEEQVNHLKILMKNKKWKQAHPDTGLIDLKHRYGLITDDEYKEYQQL